NFVKYDTKVVVLSSDIKVDNTESNKLAKDLLSIIIIFTASKNQK
ncbi:5942_t:CDS:1, partial [Funneliformis mosseae]